MIQTWMILQCGVCCQGSSKEVQKKFKRSQGSIRKFQWEELNHKSMALAFQLNGKGEQGSGYELDLELVMVRKGLELIFRVAQELRVGDIICHSYLEDKQR